MMIWKEKMVLMMMIMMTMTLFMIVNLLKKTEIILKMLVAVILPGKVYETQNKIVKFLCPYK